MSGKQDKKLRRLVTRKHITDIEAFNGEYVHLLNNMSIRYRAKYAWKVLTGRLKAK